MRILVRLDGRRGNYDICLLSLEGECGSGYSRLGRGGGLCKWKLVVSRYNMISTFGVDNFDEGCVPGASDDIELDSHILGSPRDRVY